MTSLDNDEIRKLMGENVAIEIGTVVWLKSGGPAMTVALVEGDKVSCKWFDKVGKFREAEFVLSMLSNTYIDQNGKGRGLLLIGDLAVGATNDTRS